MKEYTMKCDFCGESIDYKRDKYHTFEVPGVVDVKKNELVRYETHFCESHDILSLMLEHSEYELSVLREFNGWLKNNRWNPALRLAQKKINEGTGHPI